MTRIRSMASMPLLSGSKCSTRHLASVAPFQQGCVPRGFKPFARSFMVEPLRCYFSEHVFLPNTAGRFVHYTFLANSFRATEFVTDIRIDICIAKWFDLYFLFFFKKYTKVLAWEHQLCCRSTLGSCCKSISLLRSPSRSYLSIIRRQGGLKKDGWNYKDWTICF